MIEEISEPTDTELKILNASDQEIEAMQADTELELLNRKVAAIAGWTDITLWDSKNPKKVLIGTNLAHPEWGIFVPDYVRSLDAIAKVFDLFDYAWTLSQYADDKTKTFVASGYEAETPAIAMCKLLLAINPDPIQPKRKAEVVEATFS